MAPSEIEEKVSGVLAAVIRLQEELIHYQRGELVSAGMLRNSLNRVAGKCMAVASLLEGRENAEYAADSL